MKSKSFEFKGEVVDLETCDLDELALRIRNFLMSSISKSGGHIGANLGVIELTISLHKVFDVTQDILIFDTGHQGYTHKILTGRSSNFTSLNKFKGMSRFLSRSESKVDRIEASHAGTALSIAAGIEKGQQHTKNQNRVIVVVGDGSLGEGMALEALVFLGSIESNIIIVLNDNGMAIAPTVGSLGTMFMSEDWKIHSQHFFSAMGFHYLPVSDGHSIEKLVENLSAAKENNGPTLVHVKTNKGQGLALAKDHPYKMHFSQPFNLESGVGVAATISGETMGSVASKAIEAIMALDSEVFVVTPATPYASYLDELIKIYPDRVIDVGMAEQHSVGYAVGLALGGMRPILCIQSTFLQRAYDQIIHDFAYMRAPFTIIAVRTGLAGLDSPTHHGMFDIPILRTIPNLAILSPVTHHEIPRLISMSNQSNKSTIIVLPYEPVQSLDFKFASERAFEIIKEGDDGTIITLIGTLDLAQEFGASISLDFQRNYSIIVVRRVKPFDLNALNEIVKSNPIVVIEEYLLSGGLGSLVLESLSDLGKTNPVFRMGINDVFPPAGQNADIRKEIGLETSYLTSNFGRFLENQS
jgi:1-deoxy-D-xylulose-5-phosphate synthase